MSAAQSFAVWFDAPPSTNSLFVNVRGKGRVRSPLYEEWRHRAGWQINAQRPAKISGPYEIDIRVRRASLRRDLDNYLKASLDLLVHLGLVSDDRFVEKIVLRWTEEGNGVQVEARAVA